MYTLDLVKLRDPIFEPTMLFLFSRNLNSDHIMYGNNRTNMFRYTQLLLKLGIDFTNEIYINN